MPRMGDALAGLDILNVRLADPEHRSNRRLCNAHERGLYIFDEHIASQPSGQVRRIPIPDGLLVRLLGGRTLREELRPLCRSASLVEIPTSYRQTAFGTKATISPPEFFPQPGQRRSILGASTVGKDGRPFASRLCR